MMESGENPPPVVPRPAATVVLLRDGPQGLEVFMVKRHGLSDVLGGAYVFPGGKLDPADTEPGALGRLGAADTALHGGLGEPDLDPATAGGLFVAACRETFEEAGVLLAAGAGAQHLESAQAWARAGVPFGEVLARLGLPLDCGNIVPWSRWITPRVAVLFKKRFDARFFLATVPDGQQPRHDDHEATGSFWLRPREVLEQFWEGSINLAPAQIMSIAALARHARVADAVAEARNRRPPTIEPEVFEFDAQRALAFPGDPRHPVAGRALPGPLFLVYRNERFEPADGFGALLD